MSSGMSISDARQTIQSLRKRATRRDQVFDETLLDVQVALVFAQIADLVALGQHAPDLRPQSERVREYLKNDVAVTGAVPMPTQGGQTKAVGCIVGKVKTTFDSVCFVACILQPRQRSANQPSKLLGICRFPRQWPTRPGQVIKWGDQARCLLTRFSVAPAPGSQTHGLAAVVASAQLWNKALG